MSRGRGQCVREYGLLRNRAAPARALPPRGCSRAPQPERCAPGEASGATRRGDVVAITAALVGAAPSTRVPRALEPQCRGRRVGGPCRKSGRRHAPALWASGCSCAPQPGRGVRPARRAASRNATSGDPAAITAALEVPRPSTRGARRTGVAVSRIGACATTACAVDGARRGEQKASVPPSAVLLRGFMLWSRAATFARCASSCRNFNYRILDAAVVGVEVGDANDRATVAQPDPATEIH